MQCARGDCLQEKGGVAHFSAADRDAMEAREDFWNVSRQLFGDCSRGVTSEVMRWPLMILPSSRVARPQDASKALKLVSLLSSSARSYSDTHKQRMLRPVSEVADIETRLGPAGRFVDPIYQHSRRHHVGLIRDLEKAGSIGFFETAVEHVGPFFVAKKAGARRFIPDARASNRSFLSPPSGPLLTAEGLCHVEFQGASEDVSKLVCGFGRYQERVSSDAHSSTVASVFFALPTVLASKVGYTGKTVEQKRLAPDSLIYLVPTTLPIGCCLAMLFCVTDHCIRGGNADSPLVTTPHHRCSEANTAWDRKASVGRMLTILGSGSWRKLH